MCCPAYTQPILKFLLPFERCSSSTVYSLHHRFRQSRLIHTFLPPSSAQPVRFFVSWVVNHRGGFCCCCCCCSFYRFFSRVDRESRHHMTPRSFMIASMYAWMCSFWVEFAAQSTANGWWRGESSYAWSRARSLFDGQKLFGPTVWDCVDR